MKPVEFKGSRELGRNERGLKAIPRGVQLHCSDEKRPHRVWCGGGVNDAVR